LNRTFIIVNKNKEITLNQDAVPIPQSRLNKTRLFLDRLERAASKLSANGEDLTSSAVGQTMDRPISAPAITDALRKNRRRVLLLLEQNPEKWPIIRNQFRPLINIVVKSDDLRKTG
jgi:hypothetical protein